MDWQPIETMPKDGYSGPFIVYWPPERIDDKTSWYGGWSVAWWEPSERDGWSLRFQSLHVRRQALTHWAKLTAPTLPSPPVAEETK